MRFGEIIGEAADSADLLARYDEDVNGCDRGNVSKGHNVFIFVNNITGDFSIDNFGEQSRHSLSLTDRNPFRPLAFGDFALAEASS